MLFDSRIGVTQQLVSLVSRLQRKPAVMVSGSAVGFYGDAGNAELTEDSSARKRDFGYLLCDAWEQSARPVSRQGVRLCLVRTGIVLGRDGGMLGKLLPVYRLGLGAMLGDGSQWLSWIHIDDMVAILVRAVETPGIDGVFNATAPGPVTQREFHRSLASAVKRPAFARPVNRLAYRVGRAVRHPAGWAAGLSPSSGAAGFRVPLSGFAVGPGPADQTLTLPGRL